MLAPHAAAAPAPDPVLAAHPVGTIIETATGPEGLGTATFDRSTTYRYRLSRVWDTAGDRCVFMMLNPSTATALKLDPTVSRCVKWARTWGFGALEVVNVFAYRATDPDDMKAVGDPVGPANDEALLAAAGAGSLTVAAWGVHGSHNAREAHVRSLFLNAGLDLHYLRLTKDGHPGHPLYIPGATIPTRWQ